MQRMSTTSLLDNDKHLNTSDNVLLTFETVSYFLVNNKLVEVFSYISFTVMCQAIDIFGVVTNIINIVCFVKQGFKDPVNVSLFALSVADLGCLVTLMCTNICMTPVFSSADLPFDPIEFQYLTSGMLHTTFTRLTGWITAIITLERCLCITIPLQVKAIVTPQRITVILVCIVVVLISSVAPLYVVNSLGMKFFPDRNKTLIGLFFTEDREHIETISFTINNVCIPFSAFVVTIVCTITLVVKLHNKQKWRNNATALAQSETISNRNQKVAKMVVMISTIFIACFTPIAIIFIAMTLEPKFSVYGQYRYMLIFVGGMGVILESINSSVNILFYYKMSSKYRGIFCQIMGVRNLK